MGWVGLTRTCRSLPHSVVCGLRISSSEACPFVHDASPYLFPIKMQLDSKVTHSFWEARHSDTLASEGISGSLIYITPSTFWMGVKGPGLEFLGSNSTSTV